MNNVNFTILEKGASRLIPAKFSVIRTVLGWFLDGRLSANTTGAAQASIQNFNISTSLSPQQIERMQLTEFEGVRS